MKRKGISAAFALAAGLAFAAPASAVNTSTQTIPLTQTGPGTYLATFTSTPGAGAFIDTFLFAIPRSGKATISLTSTETGGPPTNVNFNSTAVRFNGTTVPIISRGVVELRTLVDAAVNSGTATLVVQGAAGALGTYTGTLTYAIPEPAMWALMIIGFGFTGSMMRTRRRQALATA